MLLLVRLLFSAKKQLESVDTSHASHKRQGRVFPIKQKVRVLPKLWLVVGVGRVLLFVLLFWLLYSYCCFFLCYGFSVLGYRSAT